MNLHGEVPHPLLFYRGQRETTGLSSHKLKRNEMRSAFRNAYVSLSRSLNPIPKSSSNSRSLRSITASVSLSFLLSCPQHQSFRSFCSSSSMTGAGDSPAPNSSPSLEKQFKEFRVQLEESGTLREKIRAVVVDIESATRLMHVSLLLVHQSRPIPGIQI